MAASSAWPGQSPRSSGVPTSAPGVSRQLPGNRRYGSRFHSALGLAFAALIYLVCFSGSVAVFAREFQRWEQADVPPMTAVTSAAVQTAMDQAVKRAGAGIEHVYITLPTPERFDA